MRSFFVSCFLLVSFFTGAQQLNIIPQPQTMKQPKAAAYFNLTPLTVIVLEGGNLENSANFLNDYLQKYHLFHLTILKSSTSKNSIRLNFDRLDKKLPGAYDLTVDKSGVYIGG